jgi:hypothetical protein
MQQPGDGVNIDHHTIQERESKKKKMTDRRHNCLFFSYRIFFLKKKKGLFWHQLFSYI